jgi:hypothetical protein
MEEVDGGGQKPHREATAVNKKNHSSKDLVE